MLCSSVEMGQLDNTTVSVVDLIGNIVGQIVLELTPSVHGLVVLQLIMSVYPRN